MIKLGFVSAILADQTFEEVISFARLFYELIIACKYNCFITRRPRNCKPAGMQTQRKLHCDINKDPKIRFVSSQFFGRVTSVKLPFDDVFR